MKTMLKIVAAGLVVLVVLVVAAVLLLPRFVDSAQVKAQLERQVAERTGRSLSIPGSIRVSVFPWLGLELGQVSLGNPPGFQAKTFASSREIAVHVKLLPLLLERRVVMRRVVVQGLVLNLERNAKGEADWSGLASAGKQAPSGAGTPTAGSPLAGLALGGIEVRDATVDWNDRAQGRHYAIAHLDVTSGAIAPGHPVPLSASFELSSKRPALQAHFDLQSRLEADAHFQKISANATRLTVKVERPGAAPMEASVRADLAVNLDAGTVSVRPLEARVLGLEAKGELQASGLGRAAPAYQGKLDVTRFDPRKLLDALGAAPHTTDPKALTEASLQFAFSGKPGIVRVAPLLATLDQSTLRGSLTAHTGTTRSLDFDLALDRIDLDRYRAPAPSGAPKPAAGATSPATQAEAPLGALNALGARGTLRIGELTAARAHLSDLVMGVRAGGGRLRLDPVTAKLYGGTLKALGTVDAKVKPAATNVQAALAGVQAAPLLRDLRGEARISGTADIDARVQMRGTDAQAIERSLGGQMAFDFRHGAIEGINIAQMLRGALATLKGETAPAASAAPSTDFTELKGTVQIRDGIARNEDLSLKSPLLRVSGRGQVDLPKRTVDYLVTPTLVATLKGEGGQGLADLTGIPVPIRVSGSLSAPSYRPDLRALASALARSRAGAVLKKEQQKILERLGVPATGGGATQPGTSGGAAQPGASGGGLNPTLQKLKGLFGN